MITSLLINENFCHRHLRSPSYTYYIKVTPKPSTLTTTFTYHRLVKLTAMSFLMSYTLLLSSLTLLLTLTDLLDSCHPLSVTWHSRTTHGQNQETPHALNPLPWQLLTFSTLSSLTADLNVHTTPLNPFSFSKFFEPQLIAKTKSSLQQNLTSHLAPFHPHLIRYTLEEHKSHLTQKRKSFSPYILTFVCSLLFLKI